MAYLGRKGAPAPINASDIPDDSITSAKIVADAVGSSDLAPDIALTGGSVGIPSVTTANRPGESGGTNASQTATVGMIIYNTTIGIMQQYNATGWASIDSPPTVSSLNYPGDDTALDIVGEFNDATCDYNNDPTIAHDTNSNMKAGMSVSGTGIPVGATIASVTSTTAFELSASTTGGAVTNGTLTFNTQTLIITGTNFKTGITVTIDGTAPSTVTKDSSTQITVTGTPTKTAGTKVLGLVVTNLNGLAGSINVDYSPLPGWSSPASGNLGTLYITGSAISTIALTGGADTDSYTLTNTLPPGLVMDPDDGDIDGTITGSTYTTYNFTVNAIDAQAQSSPRLFNIITAAPLPTGGVITDYGSFKVHTFILANGATQYFDPNGAMNVDYLIVAGGGAGGHRYAGGGGAGGVRTAASLAVTDRAYTIIVGAGGAGVWSGSGPMSLGYQGGTSSMDGTDISIISATGGGRGGNYNTTLAGAGGSGAGGNATTNGTYKLGAAGNQGGYSPVEGYAGGAGSTNHTGGGGGGAGGAGLTSTGDSDPGDGGVGIKEVMGLSDTNTKLLLDNAGIGEVSGSYRYVAGGGGSGVYSNYSPGVGGLGNGGGSGSYNTTNNAPVACGANMGAGGSGNAAEGLNWSTQVTGGSGVVIIRYAV